MIYIPFIETSIFITVLWVIIRAFFWIKNRRIDWKREAELLLVYVCIMVIARITFFPLEKIDGKVQPLVFDIVNAFSFRINVSPFVNLLEYDEIRDAIINFIGNTAMFIPVGMIWPLVFRELDSHWKTILAGIGFSILIEVLQLPFYDRVSDIDDLILNTVGYLMGYGIYLVIRKIKRASK
ncbi:MAG: VanZ family protein [Oscillospiraceae bacterium]|nr:VanZ family protein [Oscillospiraceae bacterium]